MKKSIALEAKNISKTFGNQTVISDLDIQVVEGEILAIMGVSGAGKSTLLRIMAGLESYDQGFVKFEGEALERVEDTLVPGHEEIQYVAQDFRLLKNRTVLENIKEALLAFKDSFTEQKVDFLLNTLQLSHLKGKKIELLSGGEKQRLAIARAMASEPAILLLDEPFTQLDQINKQLLIKALLEINKSLETTILLVTHQADEVFQLAHRAGVLHQAVLSQLGTPQQLYHEPLSYEVASLFGNINILTHQLLEHLQLAPKKGFHYGIRPENIQCTLESQNDGLKAEVLKSTFMGTHYLLSVKSTQQQEILVQHPENVAVGEKVYLHIAKGQLIEWATKS